jgi:type IV secretory pathway ATPase VirB11/archaellum biosynthesis ATPase
MISVAATLAKRLLDLTTDEDTELCINSPGKVFVERRGALGMVQLEADFVTLDFLKGLAPTVAGEMDLVVQKKSPIMSASLLSTGERIQIVMPPACHPSQFIVSIRKHAKENFTWDYFNSTGYFDNTKVVDNSASYDTRQSDDKDVFKMAQRGDVSFAIEYAMKHKMNILISGDFGCGKTAFANTLLNFVPLHERIGTIEDSFELNLEHKNIVRLNTLSGDASRDGANLMVALMRLNVDRIIVGELRDSLVQQYFRSLMLGCRGTVSTIHGASPLDAVKLLTHLYLEKSPTTKPEYVHALIKSSVDMMIFVEKEPQTAKRHVSNLYFPKMDKTLC